ncbi:MAG: C39 family peptidase [Patescibacteria group bacterium]|nr:C39 family peptidase [Patescibacteria group bacterium]
MPAKAKKFLWAFLLLTMLACIAYLAVATWTRPEPNSFSYSKKQADQTLPIKPETTTPDNIASSTPPTPLPTTVYWPAPFTPQAPTANWDVLHNEACEEASAIMANAYFSSSSETSLAPELVEEKIGQLTAWQDGVFGYHLDTTSAETARMMEKVYGLKTKLVENFTQEDIKRALAEGKLVAISENGRLLKNPYYKSPGPIHHMLLLKGYDSSGAFITNDSGTKRGLNYPYDFQTIYAAAADWDHTTSTVDENKKIAIEIWR